MAKYIDREKLKEFPIRRNHYDEINGNAHFINGIETVFEYADSLPSEDVARVKCGKWEYTEAYPHWVVCSCCHKRFVPNAEMISLYNIPKTYCPNCGAKMDGKECSK